MKKVVVDVQRVKTDPYDVFIGNGYIGEQIKVLQESGSFFLLDKKVADLHSTLWTIPNELVEKYISGEEFKSMDELSRVLTWLYRSSANRSSTLTVVGGGITGDLGGLAASIYMRGIDYIQVPTTLLSMVDSSVGGKTAINFEGVKNLVGSFKQPKKVYIDTGFLATIDDKEYMNGVAEIIKMATLFDDKVFDSLVESSKHLLKRTESFLQDYIHFSVYSKAEVVKKDEQESGLRKLLNYGHTVAHAIESDSSYKVSHGYAVMTGAYLESKFLAERELCSHKVVDAVKSAIDLFGFEDTYKFEDKEKLRDLLIVDKKTDSKGINLAAPVDIGSGKLFTSIDVDDFVHFLYNN